MAIAVVLYVIFCLLAGFAGIYRRMGFFGTFFLSLLLTPLLVLLLLILTGSSRDARDTRRANERNAVRF
jgi:uncharacterized membrane protein